MIDSPAEKAWNNFISRVEEIKKAKVDLAEKEIQLYEEFLTQHTVIQKTKTIFSRLFKRK